MKETMKLVQFGQMTEGQSERGPWRKQVVIFETSGDYPKQIAIDFYNGDIEEIGKYNPGDTCTVKFDISSREYNGKWYTNVKAFGIEGQAQQPQPQPQYQPAPPKTAKQTNMFNAGNGGDLPF